MNALRRIVFVDRDGTLIEEPHDQQVDSLAKLRLVRDVVPALRTLREAGFELVMVTNQDGLGSAAFPLAAFEPPQKLLLEILETQGIEFSAVHVDASTADAPSPGRKPGIGMVIEYLRGGVLDFARSAVVGDRATDVELARNIGVRGFRIGEDGDWNAIVRAIVGGVRTARVERNTAETRIRVDVDLDREATADVATGLGFLDHMLAQLARHGGFALTLRCAGDLHVDEHHVVEDCALALGEALAQALGDKRGIARYGFALPMDESRAEALLDLSGRPFFLFSGEFLRDRVGDLPTELVPHFFRSFADGLRANLHLNVRGENTHHMVEACFKATARALRMALRREGVLLPSTKEAL